MVSRRLKNTAENSLGLEKSAGFDRGLDILKIIKLFARNYHQIFRQQLTSYRLWSHAIKVTIDWHRVACTGSAQHMPLRKSWGSKKNRKLGEYCFSVTNCIETHGTECDNSVHNNSFCLLRSHIICTSIFKFVPPPLFVFNIYTACTKNGQLIMKKIIKIVVTRCHISRLKCTKFDFG